MTKLIYVDGVYFNPDNVTWLKLLDPGLIRLHFIGGNFVDVDKDWDAFRKRLRNAGVRICGDTIEDRAWECDAPQEENKEGKETFPPAPPIEKREQTKEAPPPTRVRAGVSDVFLKQWKITEAFFQYWLKKTEGKKLRNPERSVHNYWTHRKTDKAWFEFLRDYEATQAKAEEKHYNLLGEVK